MTTKIRFINHKDIVSWLNLWQLQENRSTIPYF
ncbi:MAG: hypothetical protein ACI97N_000933, partial [Cognaticolwellia sp.]